MVRANGLMAAQEGVKTPHRIELCEEQPVRPTRNYRKRRHEFFGDYFVSIPHDPEDHPDDASGRGETRVDVKCSITYTCSNLRGIETRFPTNKNMSLTNNNNGIFMGVGALDNKLAHAITPSDNFIYRIITSTPPKTENEELKPPITKNALKSKPLKTSNGFTNMTNGHALRSRAARAAARAAESHKLTEYFKEELKSPKIEPPASPPPLEKTVKIESKVANGTTNHKLTEYFPVRRSVRKTSKCVMAEKMRDLERAVREQREDGLQVAYFDCKGRGVIATRAFGRGQFVVEYAGELVGLAEAREREYLYAQDPDKGCYMYYFRHGDQQYCIDATAESGRLGRLVNHSRAGNLVTKAVWVDGPRLVLVAAHDIAPGDELTYDYGDRSREALQHHPWLAF